LREKIKLFASLIALRAAERATRIALQLRSGSTQVVLGEKQKAMNVTHTSRMEYFHSASLHAPTINLLTHMQKVRCHPLKTFFEGGLQVDVISKILLHMPSIY
jgi:hypothetical protein